MNKQESNEFTILNDIKAWVKQACNACKEFTPNKQSEINCRYCIPTQILDIISKAKGEPNE